ncbi:Right handed beta helix region [Actinacidiphila yanglinensis]|uniref:Right handed beta helix region n=1 Tax=Actinacidiphila yanglinensis TaxID=310779 RepID=A0A1H6CIJ8_9ACTN|nr:fibronectin type III domain-containing protein [Actinacidiphila yanglinensis]SEG72738.1 Right handed beta helix region [Actinacidiphila yanglinensis]
MSGKPLLPSLAALALALTGLAVAPTANASPPSHDVYVSPYGNDHAQGDARHPVRTLERAQDLVRDSDRNLTADLTVRIASGTYRLSKPLTLDSRDSGSNGHRVVWQGTGDTVISGGKQVTGWHQVPGHSGLWAAPAPQGLSNTRQLYVDGVRADRAAGEVPVTLTKTATGYTAADGTLAGWPDIAGAEFVYTSGESLWNFVRDGLGQWTQPRCDIASASGTSVTMVQPCWDNSTKRVEFPDIPGRTVSMVGPGALTNGAHVTYMENARELLDTPGEWYLDRASHTVYYMPRKGEDLRRADVEAPALEKLVDGLGTAAAPLHDIAFRGLQFSYATWLTPSSDEGFSEIQAGYTISGPTGYATEGLCGFSPGGDCPFGAWTKEPGNVAIDHGRDLDFSDDAFVHLGAAGLELGDGAQNATVRGSVFTDISGNGVEVGGVDKPLPTDDADVTRNVQVTDNHLYDLPREFSGGVPIVNGYTQHDLISHNQIDHVGYSAISMGWGGWPDKIGSPATPNDSHDNTVSDNLITDYMQGLDDGGGIYTQGLTGTSMAAGEKVTGNVIHGQFGLGKSVYTDNGCTYETVSGNVLYGASYANVFSTHVDYRDTLHNNDPTLISGNWWEQGDANGSNKGVVTQDNHIIASPSDAPADVVAAAGLEPVYRGILGRRFTPASVPVAPSRVATAAGEDGTLMVAFNPTWVDGGSPLLGYRATAVDPAGRTAATTFVSAADFTSAALVRLTGLTDGVPYKVTVTAVNSHGSSAPSLPSAPLAPKAATVLPPAPTGLKLKAQPTAATINWTPPTTTGDSPVIGYRIVVTDTSGSRTVDVSGRDVLVTQPSAHPMFRVLGGLTPATTYTVTVATVTPAGTGPSATVTGTTPAA